MNIKFKILIIIVAITGAGSFYIVGFDQGHILSLIYGEEVFTDLYIHELTHDMRHASGFTSNCNNTPDFSIDGVSFTELHIFMFPILFLVITISIIIIIWKKYKKRNV